MEKISYNLKELCRTANVTERTVRYYIKEGLLPPPIGSGPFSRYGYEHWLRLAFVRRLKEEFLPLNEIKTLLSTKSVDELVELAQRVGLTETSQAEPTPPTEGDRLGQLLQPAPTALRQQLNPTYRPTEPTPVRPLGRPNLTPLPMPQNSLPTPTPINANVAPWPRGTGRMAMQPPSFYPNEEDEPLGDEWERLEIAPGVELHVQKGVRQDRRKTLEKVLEEARRLLKDEA